MHDHSPGPEGAFENRGQMFLIAPNGLANIKAMKKKKKNMFDRRYFCINSTTILPI